MLFDRIIRNMKLDGGTVFLFRNCRRILSYAREFKRGRKEQLPVHLASRGSLAMVFPAMTPVVGSCSTTRSNVLLNKSKYRMNRIRWQQRIYTGKRKQREKFTWADFRVTPQFAIRVSGRDCSSIQKLGDKAKETADRGCGSGGGTHLHLTSLHMIGVCCQVSNGGGSIGSKLRMKLLGKKIFL